MQKSTKLLGLALLLIPLSVCLTSFQRKDNNFLNASADTLNLTSEKGTLYENRSAYTTTFNAHDFEDPSSFDATSKLSNGAKDIGSLTVVGSFVNEGVKNGVSNSGYTSLKVKDGEVHMTYKFHSVSTCSSIDKYTLNDCPTTSMGGFSLGNGRKIGTGAVVLAKMNEGGNWTFVNAWTNLKDGDVTNTYIADYNDISKGTYYKFIAGYQFQEKDGSVLLFASKYRGYSEMQEITIRLGIGGASIKFAVDYTKEGTFNLETKKYEQVNSPILELKESNRVDDYSLSNIYKDDSNKNLGSFELQGELLRGSNNSNSLEGDVPNYIYNGSKAKVKLSFKNNKSDKVSSSNLGLNQINSDYVEEVNLKEIDLNTYGALGTALTPQIIKNGLLILEYKDYLDKSLSTEETFAPYNWVKLDYATGIDLQDCSFEIDRTKFNLYSGYRAIYVTAYSVNGEVKLFSQTCYFNIIVNSSKFTDSYKMDDDKNVQGSIEYNAKANQLSEAISLEDGSVCCSTIAVYNEETTYTVEYSKNDDPYTTITSFPKEFKETGMYRFRVTNSFGDINVKTIYLLDVGEDNGRSIFFPNNNGFLISEEKRMYDPNSRIPVYGTNSSFAIESNEFLPGLIGSIFKVGAHGEKQEVISFNNLHRNMNGILSEPGEYLAVIKTGQDNAFGDQIKYTFHFEIRDPNNYKPTINYDLLHSGAEFFNLMSKVYEVPYQSLGEGSYNFVFPYTEEGFQDALDFADKIEALDIVLPSENSNVYTYKGVEYTSRLTLFAQLHENALARISECLLNKSIIKENTLDYYLPDIENSSIDSDIFVVSSEVIFQYLVSDQIFLNDYTFRQIREYETSCIQIENVLNPGEIINIEYGQCVNDVLTSSGLYKITETNWSGNPNVYYGSYVVPGENLAKFNIRYLSGSTVKEFDVDQNNTSVSINLIDAIYFKEAFDITDESAIIAITKMGPSSTSKTYLLSELENKVMDMSGTYLFTVTNRFGVSYSFTLLIKGNPGAITWEPHIDNSNVLVTSQVGGN